MSREETLGTEQAQSVPTPISDSCPKPEKSEEITMPDVEQELDAFEESIWAKVYRARAECHNFAKRLVEIDMQLEIIDVDDARFLEYGGELPDVDLSRSDKSIEWYLNEISDSLKDVEERLAELIRRFAECSAYWKQRMYGPANYPAPFKKRLPQQKGTPSA